MTESREGNSVTDMTGKKDRPVSRKFHYAWIICTACTLLVICNMGLCSNILSVYLPFLKENGLTSEQGSAVLSIRCVSSFLVVFLVPWYYGRFSLRTGGVIATFFGAAAAFVFSSGSSVGICYLAAILAGIAYGLGAVIPTSLLISNWFLKNRGLAMGISSAGTGLATIVFPPILTSLIQKTGLRSAFIFQAVFIIVCALLAFILLKDSPALKGQKPYGIGESDEKIRTHSGERDLSVAGWVIMVIVVLSAGGCGLASCGHLAVLATTGGYTVETVALITSIYGTMLMISKFLFGGIADRIGTKTSSMLFFMIFAAGCLFALCLDGTSVFRAAFMAGALGFGSPVFAVGIPLWAVDLSTAYSYPRTLKWFQILYSGGGILFNLIPGFISGRTGEYVSSYVFFAVMIVISLVLLFTAYRITTKKA